MSVDKTTNMNYASICISDRQRLLDAMRKNHSDNIGLEDHNASPELWFNSDLGLIECDEYYFDESNNSIEYTGSAKMGEGTINLTVSIPLSDEVLIDILSHSVKRLNKLKNVLESLK
jgi:hypothetical protein